MKVNVCGVAKQSPQMVRDKQRALNRVVLNHSDQLATHILETMTTGEVPSCIVTRKHSVVSIYGPITDCNSPLNVVSNSHNVFSSESEFPENSFIIKCLNQRDKFRP